MRKNKKGFTLVELVIVIAVIAILAAVLIPTFTTVVGNANKSAALQEADGAKTIYMSVASDLTDNEIMNSNDIEIKVTKAGKNYWFKVTDGALKAIKTTEKTVVVTPTTLTGSDWYKIVKTTETDSAWIDLNANTTIFVKTTAALQTKLGAATVAAADIA